MTMYMLNANESVDIQQITAFETTDSSER